MITAEDFFDKTAKENKKYEPRIVTAFKGVKKAGKQHADKGKNYTGEVMARGAAAGAIGGTAGSAIGAGIVKATGGKLRGGLKRTIASGLIGGGIGGAALLGIPYGLGRMSSKKKKKKS